MILGFLIFLEDILDEFFEVDLMIGKGIFF
jgi:hypothetical protein